MATLLAPRRRVQMIRCHPFIFSFVLNVRRETMPMVSSAPGKRSKVAILLRKMSGQSGSLNRPQTPKTLPVGASLPLISAERDGYSAGATLGACPRGRAALCRAEAEGRGSCAGLPGLMERGHTFRPKV
jgi:hypothetical protein